MANLNKRAEAPAETTVQSADQMKVSPVKAALIGGGLVAGAVAIFFAFSGGEEAPSPAPVVAAKPKHEVGQVVEATKPWIDQLQGGETGFREALDKARNSATKITIMNGGKAAAWVGQHAPKDILPAAEGVLEIFK